jgi:hypothetical protein
MFPVSVRYQWPYLFYPPAALIHIHSSNGSSRHRPLVRSAYCGLYSIDWHRSLLPGEHQCESHFVVLTPCLPRLLQRCSSSPPIALRSQRCSRPAYDDPQAVDDVGDNGAPLLQHPPFALALDHSSLTRCFQLLWMEDVSGRSDGMGGKVGSSGLGMTQSTFELSATACMKANTRTGSVFAAARVLRRLLPPPDARAPRFRASHTVAYRSTPSTVRARSSTPQ